jgi:hypothetical protein
MTQPMITRPDLQERFRTLADKWKEESQFMSNTVQMALLSPYQSIIGMGEAVVPLIGCSSDP